jgi:hypothetical protein
MVKKVLIADDEEALAIARQEQPDLMSWMS